MSKYLLNLVLISFVNFNFVFLEECGRSAESGLSIGGEYSAQGQWPWLAPLFMKDGNKFFCGSSIISDRFLLSAAHCFQRKVREDEIPKILSADSIYASLGRYNLNKNDENFAKNMNIELIFIHPDWDSHSIRFDGDAALLKTVEKIIFTREIKPVCLPSQNAQTFNINGYVAGYGISEEASRHETRPKHVRIRSVTQETCLFSDPIFSRISSSRMFCAGEKGKNPCRGDSGSGWYVNVNNIYQIIGIVSSAPSADCEGNKYVVFTSVPKFIEWIEQYVDKNGPNCRRHVTCSIVDDYDGPKCNVSPVHLSSEPFCRIIFDDEPNPSIDKLNFIDSTMDYVPDVSSAIAKFKNVKSFDAGWVGIKEISRRDMKPMKDFTWVSFWGNQISEVPSNTFFDLLKLDKLILGNNKIKSIHPDTFSSNVKLRELWLQSNMIETLPRGIFRNNKELSLIYAENNKIKSIKIDFMALPKFHTITLNNNVCIDAYCDVDGFCGTGSKSAMQQKILLEC